MEGLISIGKRDEVLFETDSLMVAIISFLLWAACSREMCTDFSVVPDAVRNRQVVLIVLTRGPLYLQCMSPTVEPGSQGLPPADGFQDKNIQIG